MVQKMASRKLENGGGEWFSTAMEGFDMEAFIGLPSGPERARGVLEILSRVGFLGYRRLFRGNLVLDRDLITAMIENDQLGVDFMSIAVKMLVGYSVDGVRLNVKKTERVELFQAIIKKRALNEILCNDWREISRFRIRFGKMQSSAVKARPKSK